MGVLLASLACARAGACAESAGERVPEEEGDMEAAGPV